jgi:SAM-dependent methyltransferase
MLSALRERALARRGLVRAAQFAVTGERVPRRLPLLADALRAGAHDVVVDLGCGSAPLLDHIAPPHYVGIDEHEPSLAEGRARHAGPGREFVLASVADVDLEPWRGADAVVLSSMTHHLGDDELLALLDRVQRAEPRRILLQDAQATGLLGPLVSYLDDGDHLRARAELEQLLESRFETRCLWTYDNPLGSFHQYLLELTARR